MTLETRGLQHRYDDGRWVLRGVDAAFAPGRRTAVLGANGAGKSTLFLVLNGTLRPRAGEVRLEGRPLRHDRRSLASWRAAVGLVVQDPDDQILAPTVAEDVAYGPRNLGLSPAEVERRVDEALDELGLRALRNAAPHHLSLGERKRVAVAGILAMHPRVLVLDEPAAGLDPESQRGLLAALETRRLGGAAVVLSTHDVDLAAEWADDVVVLAEGRAMRSGSVDAVLGGPGLAAAGLAGRPWTFDVGERLRTAGLLPPGALPTRREDVLRALDRLAVSAGR
ncbi:MAG: ABC transporter ATP-binding protein [Vicinamibacteria bacterium]